MTLFIKRNPGLAFLLVLALPGCGSDGLNTVEGTVTLDDKPLKNAFVNFSPVKGGRPVSANTDEEGHFELKYSKTKGEGAPAGMYIVRITTESTDDESKPIPEQVPDKYNREADKNPDMKVEVKPGKNNFEFKLDSKGKITQEQDAGGGCGCGGGDPENRG